MSYRKRRCRVCRKAYRPSPQGGYRQVTCQESECKSKWHAKTCKKWRKANPEIAIENRLGRKLEMAMERGEMRDVGPKLGYPVKQATEILGVKGAALCHFLLGQLLGRVREQVGAYLPDKRALAPKVISCMPREQVVTQTIGVNADNDKVLMPRPREQIASREAPG